MKVITSNPLIINEKRISPANMWLPFDGKTASSATIKKFQQFANAKGYTPRLAEDGKYGPATQAAINQYGAAFDSAMSMNVPVPPSLATTPITPTPLVKKGDKAKAVAGVVKESGLFDTILNKIGVKPSGDTGPVMPDTPIEEDKKWEPWQKWALGIGIAVVVGGIIYWGVKKSKAESVKK